MRIKRVTYTLCPDKKQSSIPRDYLSSLLYEIPCETRGEDRPFNKDLFPNSKHKLINTTFYTQDDLIKSCEIVSKIAVSVEYREPIKRFFPTYRSLPFGYITFLAAMKMIMAKTGN